MAKVDTFACDVCGTQKKTTNHWLIFSPYKSDGDRDAFQVQQWDVERANYNWVTHVCGAECLGKKVAQFVADQMMPKSEATADANE